MQTQKESLKQLILENAQAEFTAYGFSKASMRRVAENSRTTVSNLYNYFDSKDTLFAAVVAPVTGQLESRFKEMETQELYKDPQHWSFAWHMHMITSVVDFIEEHRKLMELLCFKSHGSVQEGYVDRLIDRYTLISKKYLHNARRHFPDIHAAISDFFVHNIASFLFNTALEFLMHNISRKKMLEYAKEMMTFMFYGYEGLIQCDFETMKQKKHVTRR